MVNGQNGKAEVIDQNGRLFVDVSGLDSIGKGSVSFSGPSIVLRLPVVVSGTATTGTAEPPVALMHDLQRSLRRRQRDLICECNSLRHAAWTAEDSCLYFLQNTGIMPIFRDFPPANWAGEGRLFGMDHLI